MSAPTASPALLREALGATLRRERGRRRWTLRELAALSRVSVAHLSEVERGRTEASSEVLAAVCAALGLQVADLLRRTADELAPVAPAVPLRQEARVIPLGRRDRTGEPSPTATVAGRHHGLLLVA